MSGFPRRCPRVIGKHDDYRLPGLRVLRQEWNYLVQIRHALIETANEISRMLLVALGETGKCIASLSAVDCKRRKEFGAYVRIGCSGYYGNPVLRRQTIQSISQHRRQ